MTSNLQQRIERAERAVEWVQAQAGAERLLRWAEGTGQLTSPEVATLRADLQAMAPFVKYVAGNWQPPEDLVPNLVAQDAMLAAVQSWESEQEITR